MPPALVVSLVLGSLYGLLFFLLAGGGRRGMFYYWVVGALAFLIGQFAADFVHVSSLTLGDVHVVEGSLLCWIALYVMYNRG